MNPQAIASLRLMTVAFLFNSVKKSYLIVFKAYPTSAVGYLITS